jgi:hypothetical protein
MTPQSNERKSTTKNTDICTDKKCEKNPCYYNAKNVETMLQDIHEFMIIKKQENGFRDKILEGHTKQFHTLYNKFDKLEEKIDTKLTEGNKKMIAQDDKLDSLSTKVSILSVMGAITLAVLGAFLTITTYLIIKSISG